jgi:ribosome biogenesis GTPase A
MELKRVYLDPSLSNHLKIGIVGGTNVGKSSLFNVLIRQPRLHSLVDNSLFTTIDPCSVIVTPPDPKMNTIHSFLPSQRTFKPLKVTVIDTAGLISGSFREVNNPFFFWSFSHVLVEERCWDRFIRRFTTL